MANNNPYSGGMPLNYQQHHQKEAAKATSYRPGETHKLSYRNPHNDRTIMPRNDGNALLRRYPNGVLDIDYVANKVIDVAHKIQDGGFVTEMEKALLTLVLPKEFKNLIDPKLAQTMTKLSNDERMLLAVKVHGHKREELNWNAGRGGGSVPGRSQTRS